MVLNPDKCSFMLLDVDDELQTNLVYGNLTLKNSKQEKVISKYLLRMQMKNQFNKNA